MKRLLVAMGGLLLLVLAVAVILGSEAGATRAARRQSSVQAIAARREQAALREAKRLLRAFVPPSGAHRIPQPKGYGGPLRWSGPWPLAEVVDVHRFWSVHQSFDAVVAYIHAHRPRGFETEMESGGKRYHNLQWSFDA